MAQLLPPCCMLLPSALPLLATVAAMGHAVAAPVRALLDLILLPLVAPLQLRFGVQPGAAAPQAPLCRRPVGLPHARIGLALRPPPVLQRQQGLREAVGNLC